MPAVIIEQDQKPFARVAIQEYKGRNFLVIQRKNYIDRLTGQREWRGGAWLPLTDSSDVESILDLVSAIPVILKQGGWTIEVA